MFTMFPSKKVFDIWTELGNKGWDRDALAGYYRKFNTFHQPDEALQKDLSLKYMDFNLYGTEGPVQTSITKSNMPITKAWADANKELGTLSTFDPITGQAVGSFTSPSYIDPKTSTRSHAGVAYYEPISSRPNLHLKEGATVQKIILTKSSAGEAVATGVKYTIDGEIHVSHAKREVILSAGSFNSPALLELSGIGDEQLLKSLGIEVVVSNPNVGENLQDHPMNMISAEVVKDELSLDVMRNPKKQEEASHQYTANKTGPLSAAFNAVGYLPVDDLSNPADKDVLKKLIEEHVDGNMDELSNAQKIQAEHLKSIIMDPNDSTCYFATIAVEFFPLLSAQGINTSSIAIALVHPFSRGSSHIQSSDPSEQPRIDPKYLSHPMDLEVFSRHLLHAGKVFSTQPFASMFKPGGRTNLETLPFSSLEDAKAWAKSASYPQYHASGTCAMIPKELGGVVSDKLIVHGTKNLRVVDASIFPMVPKGPITSTVYAVAERAADIIKADM
jgi:choline dehydrogenase-like flavoprotein